MTAVGTLARRYAKALLELAEEQGQLEQVGRELAGLREAWDASEDLRDAFENPAVTAEQRRAILDALATRMGLSPTVTNALRLLSDRRRLRHLPEVAEAFERLAEAKEGRIRAEVTTAAAMPEPYYAELQKALESVTGRKVALVRHEDPSLIGGVITKVGDRVFDGSLRARLNELEEQLLTE
ncbi:MAG: F0F1 ATP synthase subunit delta [Myxococcota bacterium]